MNIKIIADLKKAPKIVWFLLQSKILDKFVIYKYLAKLI